MWLLNQIGYLGYCEYLLQQIQPSNIFSMATKLAEMVLQKMKDKKLKEQINRPHREVLQLLVQFEVEDYNQLQADIDQLNTQIQTEKQLLSQMQQCVQDFENTGKKQFPRIIIKPDFIGTDNIQPLVKEYYRKSANSFLREDLLRKRQYSTDTSQFQALQQLYKFLNDKQTSMRKDIETEHRIFNEKRVRNLKEDLRLRGIRQDQANIRKTIEDQKYTNRDLIAQYDLKKNNLDCRQEWADNLVILIEEQKKLIQHTYNPVTYREYLKKIFNIRTKNQSIQNHLLLATKKLEEMETIRAKNEEFLEKNDQLFVQGKLKDSPSKKKRYSLGVLESKKKPATVPIQFQSLLSNLKNTMRQAHGSPIRHKKQQQQQQQQQRSVSSVSKDKSFSTSIGRTTASSLRNLMDSSMKQNIHLLTEKKTRSVFKESTAAKLFS